MPIKELTSHFAETKTNFPFTWAHVKKRYGTKRTGKEVVPRSASGRTPLSNASQDQIVQLTLKFQLAHFVVSKSKPYKLYADFVEFDRDVRHVKTGSGYSNTCLY